jgi:hypothetical protein
MPALHPQAGLAASENGRWLAWSEAGRLRVRDRSRPMQLAELAVALEPPFELAVSDEPERLLILQSRGGNTAIRVFALPELRELVDAPLSFKGETQLVAMCGSVAVLRSGPDSLIVVDLAKLRAAPLPVRGPIQIVAQSSPDHVLVGARGKLEVWSVVERRPTHRLGLPLPRDAGFGGVGANGRLLWLASSGAPGWVQRFRLADGKQLATSELGGVIRAVAADPASATLVAAVEPEVGGALQLIAFDLETRAQRALAFEPAIAAFCLAGMPAGMPAGAPADAVAVLADEGAPVLLPLVGIASPRLTVAPAAPDEPEPGGPDPHDEPGGPDHRDGPAVRVSDEPSEPASSVQSGGHQDAAGSPAAAAPESNDLAARLSQWRAQVQAVVVAAPPRLVASGERGGRVPMEEPRSRSRAELYAWGISARARTTTTPPPPPQGWRVTDLAVRFQLDTRSKSLLALLYASWLDGEGAIGVPVGVLARALGNDESAWVEALAQGRLGRMGWLRSRRGRARLRDVVGRFLDEAPPRVTIVMPADEAIASRVPPASPALWPLADRGSLDAQVRQLADQLAGPVATIDAAALPVARRDRALIARLLEARLHGALPVVVGSEAAPFEPRLLDGPSLVASALPAWHGLPVWPEPLVEVAIEIAHSANGSGARLDE